MTHRQNHRATGISTLAIALALVAASCGGSDDSQADGAPATSGEETVADDTGTSEAADDASGGDESGGDGAAATIPWTAPDGMEASTIAVSPGGDQVVVGFAPPFETGELNAEVVVFDVATGSEAWRGSIDDAGDFGLGGLMFTMAGVSFYLRSLEGSQIVTFSDGDTSTVDTVDECAQFLSGTVDSTESVAYTVVPDGFCRVDVSSGVATEVTAGDLLEGSVGANGSIQYAADGSLVATVMNADGAMAPLSVDPTTLAVIAPVDEEPPSLETEYRDLLVEGPSIASGERIAATPDRSTIVLLQPGTIDVLG